MDEVFPVLAGIALGLATSPIRSHWLKGLLIVVIGVAIGLIAAWISGELAISWAYVLIDSVQTVAASVLTTVLAAVWLRRRRARAAAR